MAVGSVATQAQLNAQLAQLAQGLRTTAGQILLLWSYANTLGLTGLEALGFTPADAQAYLDAVNHLATVAQVYQGTATQATQFNFQNSLAAVTGPY